MRWLALALVAATADGNGKGPIGVAFLSEDLVAVADSWLDAIVVVNVTSARIDAYHLLEAAHVTGVAASGERLFASGQKKHGLYSAPLAALARGRGGGLARRFASLPAVAAPGTDKVFVDGVDIARPKMIALSPRGGRLYVALMDGDAVAAVDVAGWDGATPAPASRFATYDDFGPFAFAFGPFYARRGGEAVDAVYVTGNAGLRAYDEATGAPLRAWTRKNGSHIDKFHRQVLVWDGGRGFLALQSSMKGIRPCRRRPAARTGPATLRTSRARPDRRRFG